MKRISLLLLSASLLGLSGCGGKSGSSGGGTVYGTLVAGTAAPLSVKATGSNLVIPVYNNSGNPVVLGSTITQATIGGVLSFGGCKAGQTLNNGDTCNLEYTYAPGTVQGVQSGYGSLSIAKSGSSGSATTLQIPVSNETLAPTYAGLFLAQSTSPVVLIGTSTYTTLWLYNSSSSAVSFSGPTPFTVLSSTGGGTWTHVATSCSTSGGSLAPDSGCYAVYKYATNAASVKSFQLAKGKLLNSLKLAPALSTAKIQANLAGQTVYTNLIVDAQPSDPASIISLPSSINMGAATTYNVELTNTGDIPITSISASVSGGAGITVNSSDCDSELPLAPGSDVCNLVLTQNSASGAPVLSVTYGDSAAGSNAVTAPINYSGGAGSLVLNPGSWGAVSPQGVTTTTTVQLSYTGTTPVLYSEKTISGLPGDITVDDSKCTNQSLGSCVIGLSYTPTAPDENGSGTVMFNAGTGNKVTLPVSYKSTPASVANLQFYSDSGYTQAITSDNIAAKVGSIGTVPVYIKNTGTAQANTLAFAINPTVSVLSEVNKCGTTLAVGGTCSLTFSYTPTAAASGQTVLSGSYTGGSNQLQINYSATGSTAASIMYCNDANCTNPTSSVHLNAQVPGGSQTQKVYVENKGTESATGATYGLSPSFSDVAISNNTCGTTLLNNTTACSFELVFTPSKAESGDLVFVTKYTDSTGSKESDLAVSYATTNVPVSNRLWFCSDATCSESLPSISLSAQVVSTTPTTQNVYVKNVGSTATGALTGVYQTQVTGLSATIPSSCAGGLTAGAVCSDPLVFSYTAQSSAVSGNDNYNVTAATWVSTFPLTVYYSTIPTPPANGIMAGYLSTGYMGPQSPNYVTIGQAADVGYNVVILAFGVLDSSQKMSWVNNTAMGVMAYDGARTGSACAESAIAAMISDIKTHKANGSLKYVLLSLGGQNDTFKQPIGSAQINLAAQNVVNFLNQYYLDGVDFDLENKLTDPAQLDLFIKALKALKPGIIISAPPQVNTVDICGGSGEPICTLEQKRNIGYVTTAHNQDYNIAIESGDFDYLWIQAYNTGGASNLVNYNGVDFDETMAGYILGANNYFITTGNKNVVTPSTTNFIVGQPASQPDAGDATVWHNPNYLTSADVLNALATNYATLGSNLKGAMAWSINRDMEVSNCGFATKVGGVVGTKSSTSCPTNINTYWLNICSWGR